MHLSRLDHYLQTKDPMVDLSQLITEMGERIIALEDKVQAATEAKNLAEENIARLLERVGELESNVEELQQTVKRLTEAEVGKVDTNVDVGRVDIREQIDRIDREALVQQKLYEEILREYQKTKKDSYYKEYERELKKILLDDLEYKEDVDDFGF